MTTETQYDLAKYRYYDPAEFGEDLMPQSESHDLIIRYVCLILDWLFHNQNLTPRTSMEFRFPAAGMPPISPDIAVLERTALANLGNRKAYFVGTTGSAPGVVFEFASDTTWERDLEEKPQAYAQLGVREYFSFDPTPLGIWKDGWQSRNRLIGWRTNATGQAVEIVKDARGWLWSEELQSWLAVDNRELRFYDVNNNLRLTGQEAAEQLAESERQQAEIARQRAAATDLQNEKLLAKLRELGIDPDEVI